MDSKQIVWSHSRLNTLINNPAEYCLNYIYGIKPKVEKAALSLGSAVHYGLEIGSSDLTDYYKEKGNFKQQDNFTEEQLIAESMVQAFLDRKPQIYDEILKDTETGETLNIIDEQHELQLVAVLPSKMYPEGNQFLGIIDLLFLTEKGWILCDYKTSSRVPEWEHYKSQLYKYDTLLRYTFPDTPLYKVVIINLQKTAIRKKKGEDDTLYRRRIQDQYIADESLINYHIYEAHEFDRNSLTHYNEDLSELIDTARMMIDHDLFFLNYSNITGLYGPSIYADIFYDTPDNYLEYKIKDSIYDCDLETLLNERDCDPIDMLVLKNKNVLNKYSKFKDKTKEICGTIDTALINKEDLFKKLKATYICSDVLLDKYYDNLTLNI